MPLEGKNCSSDDCLPETCRVYVEGASNALQELRDLQEGQRALCQDVLDGSFKFVQISGIQVAPCPEQITRLVLEDDSVIDLTEEHPVPVHDLSIVQAKDLKPGFHALSVWKHREVKIKHVLTLPEAQLCGETNRGHVNVLSVSVANPIRYRMVVTGPKGETRLGESPAMVAVGFSNLNVQSVTSRGGFLDFQDREAVTGLRRSVSEPALGPRESEEEDPPSSKAALSLGSVYHYSNDSHMCRPCNFHQRYLRGQTPVPCKNGAACTFCHEQHGSTRDRRKMRFAQKTKI